MDPWTVLVGMAICCVSAVLIYVITFLSMRERSFDEVIAEQKKRQEEEREKVKNDRKLEKEHMKKKYKKGKGDKPKEKAAQILDPEVRSSKKSQKKESKMVNLEIEPEIIEPAESIVLGRQKGKNHSEVRKRSILHNKDEVAPIAEKAVELPHKPIKPLDDLELKKLHDTKAHEVTAVKKGKGQRTDQKEDVKERKAQKVQATSVQHGIAAEEKGSTPKNAAVIKGSPVKGSHLIDTLRTAELSDLEIQSLIEVLLNRQGGAVDFQGSWNKKSQKGDPVAVMKKQLEEKETALQEEHRRVTSSTSQIKDLRTSLTAEREKLSAMEKRHQTQLKQHEAENEALKARLSNIHATHMSEIAKVKLQLEQLESEKSSEAAVCTKLRQENKILQESLSKAVADNASKGDVSSLKQKVTIMENELSNNAVRLNAAENAKKSSEEKLKKYEEQIKKLESSKKSEDDYTKQVAEMKKEMTKAESQNTQLTNDLKKATGALSTVEAECAMWKTKLQELEKHLSSLGDVGTKLQDSERKNEKLEGDMKSVAKQLTEAVDAHKDTSLKLQESEDKRQELEGNLRNLDKQLAEALRCQEDTSTELQQLRQENSALSQELKLAQEKPTQASSATAANGDAGADAQNFIHTADHERIISEKVAELSKVQTALDAQTKKNNEEVTHAVSEAEKRDREVLKRLFPALSLSDNMDHKDWLASFEKQAVQLLEHASGSEHSEKDRIHELEEENRKLQHQSEAYEKNFMQLNADQERLLHLEEENQRLKNTSLQNTSLSGEVSRLQEQNKELQCKLQEKEENITEVENKLHNLERAVETEEKKWKEKLTQAEEALSKGSESSSREQELEDLTIQQQTQIEHYRTVLTNTEHLLRQLESAEKTWEEKLQTSQNDLQKSKSECQRLQDELQALRGSTEMQGKMDDMQEELRQSSEKVDSLTKQNEELTSKVIVLESQTKAVVQVDNEDLRKELEEVRGLLEGERKRNKELSSTLVRLNGIIKTGQDALSQEQKLVKQLQDQLADRTKGSGSNANQEIEQWRETLRSKLSEKEKQLEREIAANKQLSQRLGQLGVLGASTGSSDQGTSV